MTTFLSARLLPQRRSADEPAMSNPSHERPADRPPTASLSEGRCDGEPEIGDAELGRPLRCPGGACLEQTSRERPQSRRTGHVPKVVVEFFLHREREKPTEVAMPRPYSACLARVSGSKPPTTFLDELVDWAL